MYAVTLDIGIKNIYDKEDARNYKLTYDIYLAKTYDEMVDIVELNRNILKTKSDTPFLIESFEEFYNTYKEDISKDKIVESCKFACNKIMIETLEESNGMIYRNSTDLFNFHSNEKYLEFRKEKYVSGLIFHKEDMTVITKQEFFDYETRSKSLYGEYDINRSIYATRPYIDDRSIIIKYLKDNYYIEGEIYNTKTEGLVELDEILIYGAKKVALCYKNNKKLLISLNELIKI